MPRVRWRWYIRCTAPGCKFGAADDNRVEFLKAAKAHERAAGHECGRVFKATQPALPLDGARNAS